MSGINVMNQVLTFMRSLTLDQANIHSENTDLLIWYWYFHFVCDKLLLSIWTASYSLSQVRNTQLIVS